MSSPSPAADAPRCGFIAILGAPNVGKSTLLNILVGAKVSSVSPKVQTTRMRIFGVAIRGHAQLVCIDTPRIIHGLKNAGRQVILVLNKVDLVPHEKLLAQAQKYHSEGLFTDIFMIS